MIKYIFTSILLLMCFVGKSQLKNDNKDYEYYDHRQIDEIEYKENFKEELKYLSISSSIVHTFSLINYISYINNGYINNYTNAKTFTMFALGIDGIMLSTIIQYKKKSKKWKD